MRGATFSTAAMTTTLCAALPGRGTHTPPAARLQACRATVARSCVLLAKRYGPYRARVCDASSERAPQLVREIRPALPRSHSLDDRRPLPRVPHRSRPGHYLDRRGSSGRAGVGRKGARSLQSPSADVRWEAVTEPAPTVTGLCAREDHRFCTGRVYVGHDGKRSVYRECECACHAAKEPPHSGDA
jgi:hypothetical protein